MGQWSPNNNIYMPQGSNPKKSDRQVTYLAALATSIRPNIGAVFKGPVQGQIGLEAKKFESQTRNMNGFYMCKMLQKRSFTVYSFQLSKSTDL